MANKPAGPPTLRDGPLLGTLFESLVTLSVRTYAQANEARVSHLRTRGGEHEIDLIIERGDGRVVALEVKLAATVRENDTRHLRWLGATIGDDLLDAAIITTGTEADRPDDAVPGHRRHTCGLTDPIAPLRAMTRLWLVAMKPVAANRGVESDINRAGFAVRVRLAASGLRG